MQTGTGEQTIHSINLCKETDIAAPIETVFAAVLEELGPGSEMPDGTPFPMTIEAWPGGRLYRDLGDNAGHLWAHVQVIKPPRLLELRGPLFMSYPAINFVQYRLTEENGGTHLALTHRAFGEIPAEHREGVHEGWGHAVRRIAEIAAANAGGRR